MNKPKSLIIFEGPDGAGKTAAALWYAAETGAAYAHMTAFPLITDTLFQIYVEAMLPAVLGDQDVVLDRSWLSEAIYGKVHRNGQDRLTDASRATLERLALHCGAVVVLCLPPIEVVRENFLKRREKEMLSGVRQLNAVYRAYVDEFNTTLPVIEFDYTVRQVEELIKEIKTRD